MTKLPEISSAPKTDSKSQACRACVNHWKMTADCKHISTTLLHSVNTSTTQFLNTSCIFLNPDSSVRKHQWVCLLFFLVNYYYFRITDLCHTHGFLVGGKQCAAEAAVVEAVRQEKGRGFWSQCLWSSPETRWFLRNPSSFHSCFNQQDEAHVSWTTRLNYKQTHHP